MMNNWETSKSLCLDLCARWPAAFLIIKVFKFHYDKTTSTANCAFEWLNCNIHESVVSLLKYLKFLLTIPQSGCLLKNHDICNVTRISCLFVYLFIHSFILHSDCCPFLVPPHRVSPATPLPFSSEKVASYYLQD